MKIIVDTNVLAARQNQYLTYFKAFLDDAAANKDIDKDLLEHFRQALIKSVSANRRHLLKRFEVRNLIFWRKEDSFSETNPMLTKLKDIID